MNGQFPVYMPDYGQIMDNKQNAFLRGQEAYKQGQTRRAGEQMAGGDYKGARNTFFKSGQIDQGMTIDKELQARIKRMNAAEKDRLAKVQKTLGNLALAANTPEKWSQAIQALQSRGMDVSKYADFGAREAAIAEAGMMSDYLDNARKQDEMAFDREKFDFEREKHQQPDYQATKYGVLNKGSGELQPFPADPNTGNMSDALKKALASQDAKTMTNYAEQAQGGADILRDVDALESARERTDFEGSVFDNALGRTIGRNLGGGGLGIPSSDDVAALDQMNASAGNLILSASTKLKGVLSESDMALVRGTVPDSDMSDKAAGPVLGALRAGAERAQVRASMYDAWLQTHGSGRGFQEAWTKYANDNPVFARGADGNIALNPRPARNWQDYVAAGQPARNSEPEPLPGGDFRQTMRPGNNGAPPANAPPPADAGAGNMSDDDILRRLGL